MEQLLLKMARQLEGLDEASLLALWDKYAAIVSRFEPSKRWQEAAIVLALIQAKHWKNQLFNHHWSAQSRPCNPAETPLPLFSLEKDDSAATKRPRASVLQFRARAEQAAENTEKQPGEQSREKPRANPPRESGGPENDRDKK